MKKEDKILFEKIFHEAVVYDVDFSKWDKFIRIVVAAGALNSSFSSRYAAMYNVDFFKVKEFWWEFKYSDIKLESPVHHCLWTIMDFNWVKNSNGAYLFHFKSISSPDPDVKIVCRKLCISEMNPENINIVNPGWDRPYAPFARPNIEELYTIITAGDS